MDTYKKQVDETVLFLRGKISSPPEVAIMLGTGLGRLSSQVEPEHSIPYDRIPNFPAATVKSHTGNLIFGRLAGKSVALLQGRFHYYEGYSTREITLPIRVMALLGAKVLVVTNAAGGLNPSFVPGTIMLLRDHLNFMGENPLRGPNIAEWGPRFPDLSEPYDLQLIEQARAGAARLLIPNVTTGVYAAIPGPSLETPAETRFLKNCGADGVGMSSVPEVIVAKHAGLKVLGISVIANINDPDAPRPILLDQVIDQAGEAGPRLQALLVEVLKEI